MSQPAEHARDADRVREAYELYPVTPGYVRDRYVDDINVSAREGFIVGRNASDAERVRVIDEGRAEAFALIAEITEAERALSGCSGVLRFVAPPASRIGADEEFWDAWQRWCSAYDRLQRAVRR